MGESKMPAKIWITMEDHAASWAGAFRRWHASDLDHGDEYPVYIRADLVEQMAAALRIIAGREQCIDNLMSNADVANAALSSWEAGQ